ncbi:hypothetical protein AAA527_32585 [Pseudomonas aeruginosa]|nr:hypothetical protein [Pseudomonas aeruginosa]MBK1796436.1 hypothetical protein [Pseudomonas aeruginosa]MCF3980723.1 hypothetical protein [Pseudomonas aeruginosa]MCV4121937.1 hypothetical protein [Pseudomonas aeruginosa]
MAYLPNINAAIRGDTKKAFCARRPGMTPKKRRLMKLARYLSRAIHGK